MPIQFVNDETPAWITPASGFADRVWETFDFGDVVWVDPIAMFLIITETFHDFTSFDRNG